MRYFAPNSFTHDSEMQSCHFYMFQMSTLMSGQHTLAQEYYYNSRLKHRAHSSRHPIAFIDLALFPNANHMLPVYDM